MTAQITYTDVTEIAGDEVSLDQVQRMARRYYWAAEYCAGKDVLEIACGTGPGLGYLASMAQSMLGGDISEPLVAKARQHYGNRIRVEQMDATKLTCPDHSLDVVVMCEALYYLPDASRFVAECSRVLRPTGMVLIATANKDLYDFNPSPYSHTYYGVQELEQLFAQHGFACEFFGESPIRETSLKQRILRPIKKVAVSLGVIPKTMDGKKWLKRLVFGELVPMPAELTAQTAQKVKPRPLPSGIPDRNHLVIYCAATKHDPSTPA